MAGYFAELKDNIVQRVLSSETKEWCEETFGGEWVQTYYKTEGKNYAGIGYTYVPEKENFHTPKPYESWILDDNLNWKSPVPHPNDGKRYYWDDINLMWVEIIL